MESLSEHPSTIKAHILIKQIEKEDSGCSHWLLMSLHCLLIERPNLSVKELINEIEILCPNTMITYENRIKQY